MLKDVILYVSVCLLYLRMGSVLKIRFVQLRIPQLHAKQFDAPYKKLLFCREYMICDDLYGCFRTE